MRKKNPLKGKLVHAVQQGPYKDYINSEFWDHRPEYMKLVYSLTEPSVLIVSYAQYLELKEGAFPEHNLVVCTSLDLPKVKTITVEGLLNVYHTYPEYAGFPVIVFGPHQALHSTLPYVGNIWVFNFKNTKTANRHQAYPVTAIAKHAKVVRPESTVETAKNITYSYSVYALPKVGRLRRATLKKIQFETELAKRKYFLEQLLI